MNFYEAYLYLFSKEKVPVKYLNEVMNSLNPKFIDYGTDMLNKKWYIGNLDGKNFHYTFLDELSGLSGHTKCAWPEGVSG